MDWIERDAGERATSLLRLRPELAGTIFDLGIAEPHRSGDDAGWITEPIDVRGDGEWMPDTTQVFVAKLVTNRR